MNDRIFPIIVNTLKWKKPSIDLYYPQIKDFQNPHRQEYINKIILNTIHKQLKKQDYYDNPNTKITGTYELKNNDKGILSMTIINYAYSGGAHGMTIVKGLNFDMKTCQLYRLDQLFKPGSNYIDKVSNIIKRQIKERNFPVLEEFHKIEPNQDFYIADKSIVIFFQLYDIAPYSAGIPYFPISIYELEDILNNNTPLSNMF